MSQTHTLFPFLKQPPIIVRMGETHVPPETPPSAPTLDQAPTHAAVQRVTLAVAPPALVSLFLELFSSFPFSNPFFLLSAINYCQLQSSNCSLSSTCSYTGPGTYTCSPVINYCTNGGNNCSAHAVCIYTGPGTFDCQCNVASGYDGNETYCARNYFLFLENPVIFSC